MGRFLPFLILTFAIVMIVTAWKSPEALRRISFLIWGQPVSRVSSPAVEAEGKPAEIAVQKNAKSARSSSRRQARRERTEPDSVETVQQTEHLLPVAEDPSLPSVKTESAPVYSFNSSQSPVVQMLKKGDEVESNLE